MRPRERGGGRREPASAIPRAPVERPLPVRGDPLRDHGPVHGGALLPLHPLPAPHRYGLLGRRPRPARRLPPGRRARSDLRLHAAERCPEALLRALRGTRVLGRPAERRRESPSASARSMPTPGFGPRFISSRRRRLRGRRCPTTGCRAIRERPRRGRPSPDAPESAHGPPGGGPMRTRLIAPTRMGAMRRANGLMYSPGRRGRSQAPRCGRHPARRRADGVR